MGVYQHGQRNITYTTERAPFAFDLVLLQGSGFATEFWRPVLEDLRSSPPTTGRILTCEWWKAGLDSQQLAADLETFLSSLGMSGVYLVACDDAVAVASALQRRAPQLVAETLMFSAGAPAGEEFKRAVRAFCPF